MLIKVLGSSSKGNGYILQSSSGECLLLEAGVPFKDVLRAINYDRTAVLGCCVSHEHSDHAKYFYDYIRSFVYYAPSSVDERWNCSHGFDWLMTFHPFFQERKWVNMGKFKIYAFPVEHDVPNFGYIIKHPEMGSLFFATDCMNIPVIFKGIDHWLIEANYSEEKLLLSDTDSAQKKRIINSHHSFESCVDYLHQAEAEHSKTITLIHLSSRHSDPERFVHRIEAEFGVPCFIARKGLTINLNTNVSDNPN